MMRLSLTFFFFPKILLLMMHHQDLFSCRVISTKLQQAPGSAPAPRASPFDSTPDDESREAVFELLATGEFPADHLLSILIGPNPMGMPCGFGFQTRQGPLTGYGPRHREAGAAESDESAHDPQAQQQHAALMQHAFQRQHPGN